MSPVAIGTCIVCHDDHYFLAQATSAMLPAGPVVVYVSKLAWDGSEGPWQRCAEAAQVAGAEVVIGNYPNESLHRSAALADMKSRGFTHAFVLDGDEILEAKLRDALVAIAQSRTAERVHVHMDTYWKFPSYVIRPRESLTPIVLVDLEAVKHVSIREYSGGRRLVLGPEYGLLHHLSYVGDSERILRKIRTWGHRHEVVPNWFHEKWLAWDENRLLRDLHPTHPPAYHKVERIPVPGVLASIPDEVREEIAASLAFPTVSIIIPLYGGEDDIRLCLESLSKIRDLVTEVIVVDDLSPDRAAKVASNFEDVMLVRNKQNLGFGATCNAGYAMSTGEVVIFLNSDTIVTRPALIRMVQSLMSSRMIGAVGPYSNYTGHHQQISVTYESLETMPLFAEDVAQMDIPDKEVDMLVGFCLAVKREVLERVGLFDTRFGIGMFEDNDLCYRILREEYKLVLCQRAFVFHAGSKSLSRRQEHPALLLTKNQGIYLDKWKADIECGFASKLSGMPGPPVVFNPANKPEEIDKRIARFAKKADITLCMIVKNEERVLRDCLESGKHAFVHRVIIDTGSTDATKEIAKEFGVELHEMEWPESFSIARNESLKHAKTSWIFWMDADDTIDRLSILRLLQAAIRAQKQKVCFVIPVRFVDDGPAGGTQVDHVKLFPNIPGIRFEGHIHEQILPSLREQQVEVALLRDAVVRHSGYDTSAEGQSKKREREKKLLRKDHDEDPEHPFKIFNLGMTKHFLKEHEEAIEWLNLCLEKSQPQESHVKKVYALLGMSKRELGDADGAFATFEEGLSKNPDDPELLFQTGISLTHFGQFDEAKNRYMRIKEEMPEQFSSFDVGILTFKRYHNLGTVCIASGNYSEAIEWWKKAIAVCPQFSPSANEMYEAAMARTDLVLVQEALDAIRGAEGPSESWANRLCQFAERIGQSPEHVLRTFLQSNPYAMGPLMVLSRMLLAKGDEQGAAPFLVELDRLGSAEAAFLRGMAALSRVDFWAALEHMNRAFELNPNHEPTQLHLAELKRVLSADLPAPLEAKGKAVLVGPHVGSLGQSSCKYSVVVVSYNSVTTIGECVARVLRTLGETDELIAIDNASTDGTIHILNDLAQTEPRLKVVMNEHNAGYSRGVNMGLLASRGKFLVTLNPDAFVEPGWLESLTARLKGKTALVGPMSDSVGGDQFVGHVLGGRRPPLDGLPALLAAEQKGNTEETNFLVGLCVMVSREILNKHGLLDEGTELGADDLELSWRLTSLGYKLAVAQDVFVRHVQGVSFSSLPFPERAKRQARSDFSLIRKLEAFYGDDEIPSSNEIWGTAIFDEAFMRRKLLGEGEMHAK